MSNKYIDTITATITEKEIISVKFTVIDIINYLEKTVVTGLINEIPTKLSSIRFETSKPYTTGSLTVYENGLKMHIADITEIDSQTFEIIDVTDAEDIIEVSYLEKM